MCADEVNVIEAKEYKIKMAFNSIKMQYKLIVELIVIMVAVNEWSVVRGHQMEHHNHHCDHRHPKAHDVNIYIFLLFDSLFHSSAFVAVIISLESIFFFGEVIEISRFNDKLWNRSTL